MNKQFPAECESIAIDAIYNLRAALDQAIYSAVKSLKDNGATGIDLTKRYWKFPIAKNMVTVEKSISEMRGLPQEIKDYILSTNPYYGDKQDNSYIYALNQLANINKHRHLSSQNIRANIFALKLLSGPSTVGGPSLEFFKVGGEGNTVNTVEKTAPVSSGEIGLYCGHTNNPTVYDVQLESVTVHFHDVDGLKKQGCVFQLNKIVEICENIINNISEIIAT